MNQKETVLIFANTRHHSQTVIWHREELDKRISSVAKEERFALFQYSIVKFIGISI
jgi:hypothetical protein